MTCLHRFSTFSILGFLAACGSKETGAGPDYGTKTGGGGSAATATITGVGGGSSSAANAVTSGATVSSVNSGSGGTTTTGGTDSTSSVTTTTSSTTDGATTSDSAGGSGGSSTTGQIVSTTGVGGEGTSGTDGGSTTGGNSNGDLSINDPVPGFASVAGGTTGGGTDIGSAIVVSSMGELNNAASGGNSAIILVEPGDYNGTLAPGSNKTIIGTGPGVTINGNISISGSGTSNIIIRNLAVRGLHCNTYDECKAGADGVYVGNGAHHVWLDHLDIADGQDGNLDITQGGDYITVSWTYFHYTYDKEHRYSNLIAGSDNEPNSVGKLHITYMTSHWGERVDQRQPRGRFGDIHMLNNYHDTGGSAIHGVGVDMALIAENSVYDERISIWKDMGSPRGWQGIGNEGTASGLNDSRGTVFDIPYEYTAMPASDVVAAVTSSDCGAGNTCTLAY